MRRISLLVITVSRLAHGIGTTDDDVRGEGGPDAEETACRWTGEGVGCTVAVTVLLVSGCVLSSGNEV